MTQRLVLAHPEHILAGRSACAPILDRVDQLTAEKKDADQ
jgi:hypothetical protein